MADQVPGAAAFLIATFAKYLGVMVGPEADAQAWEEALNKYLSAAMALTCRHPPVLSCARIYNMEMDLHHIKMKILENL